MVRLGKLMLLTMASAIYGASFAAPADWVLKGNYAQKGAKVAQVTQVKGIADLIKIDTGSQSNLRTGALCSIARGEDKIAQAIIVDAERDRSVALVLEGREVQAGDAVYITPAN